MEDKATWTNMLSRNVTGDATIAEPEVDYMANWFVRHLNRSGAIAPVLSLLIIRLSRLVKGMSKTKLPPDSWRMKKRLLPQFRNSHENDGLLPYGVC
jgi:hypothetical protein